MTRFNSLCAGAALVLSNLAFSSDAQATVRPYLAKGTAHFISPTQFVGAGNATHLGLYSEAGIVVITPTTNPAVFHVEGTITYTASDGSKLYAAVAGELNGATGAVGAAIIYTGGTGRLTGATGTSTLLGRSFPDGSMNVVVGGAINF